MFFLSLTWSLCVVRPLDEGVTRNWCCHQLLPWVSTLHRRRLCSRILPDLRSPSRGRWAEGRGRKSGRNGLWSLLSPLSTEILRLPLIFFFCPCLLCSKGKAYEATTASVLVCALKVICMRQVLYFQFCHLAKVVIILKICHIGDLKTKSKNSAASFFISGDLPELSLAS